MATYYSDLATEQEAALINAAARVDGARSEGKLLVARCSYLLTTSETANDILNLAKLPKGAVIVPALSNVRCSGDPGTTLTLNVGVASDTDAVSAALALSAGGVVPFTSLVTPHQLAADEYLVAEVASASSLNAVTLYFEIAYAVRG